MQCEFCDQEMWHANMSGTYHCGNPNCSRPKEVIPPTDSERIAKLEAKVAKLENELFYLKGQHGRC